MKEELTRIYFKYKKQLVPVVLVSISLFIIFRIIIPQMTSISEARQEIETKQQSVSDLRQTATALQGSDPVQTQSSLDLAKRALPEGKDISVIFSAISGAASAAGVELRNFSLQVGGLYGRAIAGSRVSGVPLVDVTVNVVSSDSSGFSAFSEELQTRLPLVEIKSFQLNNDRGNFELGFYYKPLDLALTSRQTKVDGLGAAEQNLLEQLEAWDR